MDFLKIAIIKAEIDFKSVTKLRHLLTTMVATATIAESVRKPVRMILFEKWQLTQYYWSIQFNKQSRLESDCQCNAVLNKHWFQRAIITQIQSQ